MIKKNLLKHLVVEAVSSLPLRVREVMKNVVIVVEEEPRRETSTHSTPLRVNAEFVEASNEIGIKRDEVLLGLYEGVPLIRRDSGYFGVLPDKITIFRKPIEAFCGENEEKLTTLVREVVWHEIGHHFGLSDPELYALEKNRPPKTNLNASMTKNIKTDKPIAVNQ